MSHSPGRALGIEKSVDCCFDFRGFEGGERFVADVDAVDEEEDVVVGEGDGFLVHHQREEDNEAVTVDKCLDRRGMTLEIIIDNGGEIRGFQSDAHLVAQHCAIVALSHIGARHLVEEGAKCPLGCLESGENAVERAAMLLISVPVFLALVSEVVLHFVPSF